MMPWNKKPCFIAFGSRGAVQGGSRCRQLSGYSAFNTCYNWLSD